MDDLNRPFFVMNLYFYPNRMLIPPATIAVPVSIITPARKTPRTINGNAFFIGNLRKLAIRDPVQAPVPGKGIPTNKNIPRDV